MMVPSKPVTSGHEVQEWCLATQHRLARLGKPRKHVARPRPLFSVCWVFKLIFFLESLWRNMPNLESLWGNMESGLDVFFLFLLCSGVPSFEDLPWPRGSLQVWRRRLLMAISTMDSSRACYLRFKSGCSYTILRCPHAF